MTDPNPSLSPTPVPPPARMPLEEWYPACFDWNRPQPLKLGIHRDLIAAGHDPKRVRRALGRIAVARATRRRCGWARPAWTCRANRPGW